MPAKNFHGARAKAYIFNPDTGLTKPVGVWISVSYRQSFDVQSVAILGRFSPAALVTTAVEAISFDAQGWRVIGNGPYADGRITNLKNLLTQEYIILKLWDRQTKQFVCTIHGCLPTGFSSGASAKTLAEMSNTYIGLLYDDENEQNAEASDAADLP